MIGGGGPQGLGSGSRGARRVRGVHRAAEVDSR